MSTRFYPRYVRGNPQLRIFLPDWKMILVKPIKPLPENVVTFKTDIKMTDWDIKNYLEKIYKVPVAAINSQVVSGDLRNTSQGLSKFEDYRLANVYLPEGQKFQWPELFPDAQQVEDMKDFKTTLDELSKTRKIDPNRSGIPSWFS